MKIEFRPRDLWVGIYIGEELGIKPYTSTRIIYICPLPMICVSFLIAVK